MTTETYNLPNIRTLLTDGFNDEELRRLCYDVPDFRPVYAQLAQGVSKVDVVFRLVEYAEQKMLMKELLTLARKLNPARYAEHGPYTYTNFSRLDVPIAVIAMTREQAIQLNSEAIFDSELTPYGEHEFLRKLKDIMQECGIEDFTMCYGEESRHKWKPFMTNQMSIQEIIQDVIAKLSRVHGVFIRPRYLSGHFLSLNSEERYQAREKLQKYGGVLIVDAISICHPKLRQALLQSQLIGSNDRIAIIVISPLNDSKVNQLFESQIYALHMEEAFRRSVNSLHPLYEFGITDIYNLSRRLSSILLNIGSGSLSQNVRFAIRAERGEPSGVGNIVTGGSRR
ncbi:MAG: hypothetical protein HYR94_09035 [Chloroflexi bacterium]|nr:hypothetical protein [Chloroflexota bacterium]